MNLYCQIKSFITEPGGRKSSQNKETSSATYPWLLLTTLITILIGSLINLSTGGVGFERYILQRSCDVSELYSLKVRK